LKFDYTKIIKDLTVNPLVSSKDLSAGGQVRRFKCYPRGISKELAPEHLSLYFQLVSKSEKAKAIFEAFMMDKNGKPSSCHAGSRSLLVYPQKDYKGWGWHQFVKWSDLETLHATDGLVTIVCGVIVLLDDDDDPLDAPPSDMGSHLGRLLDCADGSDVSFVVKGETFPAHRAVLAARSPVFKAKLLGAMADAKMPSITMHDISAATFKAMLRFMYTDALPADDELGGSPLIKVFKDLLAMADMYALDRL
jgi:speckle-type POZ protein